MGGLHRGRHGAVASRGAQAALQSKGHLKALTKGVGEEEEFLKWETGKAQAEGAGAWDAQRTQVVGSGAGGQEDLGFLLRVGDGVRGIGGKVSNRCAA